MQLYTLLYICGTITASYATEKLSSQRFHNEMFCFKSSVKFDTDFFCFHVSDLKNWVTNFLIL